MEQVTGLDGAHCTRYPANGLGGAVDDDLINQLLITRFPEELADAAAAAADREWTMEELMARGETAYNTSCGACHQANGEGVPGAFPAMKGSPVADGPIDQHLKLVMDGVPGTAMAGFAGQLNDVDLAAIVTYERNAWGNNKGDLIQPSEVKAAR